MNETTTVAVLLFVGAAAVLVAVLDLLVRFARRVTRGDERG